MARLPGYRRIFKTDYEPQFQNLVDILSGSINNGFETLYDALNKKLSFGDNFANGYKDISVQVDASGFPKQTSSFLLDSDMKVIGLNVVLVTPTPINAPYITFSQDSRTILISNITGLAANTRYTLRVLAYT